MTVIEGVRAYLLANASIAALVGTRIYPLRLPQKVTMPAIVLTRVVETNDAHLRGPNTPSRALVQVDAWAATHDAATALGALCRQRLNGLSGTWSDGLSPETTIRVQALLLQEERDFFEEEILGGMCRHSADYAITYVSSDDAVLI